MKLHKEQIGERLMFYPQYARLPKGTHAVKQDGGFGYAVYAKNGWMVYLDTSQNNKRKALKEALSLWNEKIRGVCLTWENPTESQFDSAIKGIF